MGNTYNGIYIWCCKYGENRYCERCANKKWCASKHTGLLNSCLGKLGLHPYLVVPLISARITLISTRVSAHCQAILLANINSTPCPGILIDSDVLVILLCHFEIGIGFHNHRSFNRNTYRKKTYVILVSFIILLKKYQCTIMWANVILEAFFNVYIGIHISVTTSFPGRDCYIVATPIVSCNIVTALQTIRSKEVPSIL